MKAGTHTFVGACFHLELLILWRFLCLLLLDGCRKFPGAGDNFFISALTHEADVEFYGLSGGFQTDMLVVAVDGRTFLSA